MARQTGKAIHKNLYVLRTSVREAERALARLTPLLRRMGQNHGAATSPRPRKIRITPQRLRALKLQGEYMGCLRHLKPRQQAKVKAAKAKSGMSAAIKLARSLGRR